MCDPLTITAVSMAASGAGTYLQSREQNKNMKRMQNAKNQAYQEGIDRQNEYAAQTTQAFNENLQNQGADSFTDQLADNSTKRLQAFRDNTVNESDDYSFLTSTPKNVKLYADKTLGEAASETDRDNTNLALLSGYGDTQFGQNLSGNQFRRAFGNVADKAGRDARLVNLDMSAASNNAYKAPGIFPMLLKTAGQAGSMYGSAGAPGLGGASSASALPTQQGFNVPFKPTYMG
jgi:hypothetical protein